MAHVFFTANASQYFGVVDRILDSFKVFKKQNTEIEITAALRPNTKQIVTAQVTRMAESISRTVTISVRLKIANLGETLRNLKAALAAGVMVKVTPYVTNNSLKTVKDRIKASVGAATAEVGMKFQTGAAAKFRETLKRMLAVLSRGSYVEVELRIARAKATLDALKSKTITLDIDVKAGTAAKIKALLALLKTLREGTKVPIKLDIAPGLEVLIKALARDLKAAADAAARLDRRLGGARGGLDGVRDSAGGAGNALTRMRDQIVSFASSMILVQGMHQAFQGLKEALIDYPAVLEGAQIGMDRLLGSADKGKEMMEALRKFAIPTPFATEDLVNKANQAVAFELVDPKSKNVVKETISLLKDVGDAAFGLNRGKEGVDRIMLAFGQMHTAQTVNAGDLKQLREVGIPVWQYLAEATRKSTKEVRKLVSEGLIPADAGIKAIRAGMRQKFGGGMEAASKTFLGALEQIKDASKDKLSHFFEPQFEALSNFAVKAAKVLGSREFDRWLLNLSNKVEETFSVVIGIYDGFVEQIRAGNPVLLGVIALLGANFIWLANAAIGKAVFNAGVSIGKFAAQILALPAPLLIAIAAAVAFGAAYKTNFLGVQTITDGVVGFVIDGVKTLSWALASAVETVSKLLNKVPDVFLNLVPGASLLKAALGDQEGLADGVMKDFEEFDKRAAEWKKSLQDTLNIDNIGAAVKGALGSLMPDIQKALGEKPLKVATTTTPPSGMPHIDTPDASADKERKARLKREKDALADSARAWDARAKAIEDAAKREQAVLRGIRDTFKDAFGSMQEDLLRLGIINNPLGPHIQAFERMIDLAGKSAKAVAKARSEFKVATQNADIARSRQEKLSGLDGVVPSSDGTGRLVSGGKMVGGGSIGDQIAQNAVAMQKKWGDRIGKVFYRSCDRLADITVNGATNAFRRYMGPGRGRMSAAETMAGFRRAGIGMAPDGTRAPGDIVYSGARYGRGAGHVQIIGPDGRYYDQYGAHARPKTPPQWIVRSGVANGKFAAPDEAYTDGTRYGAKVAKSGKFDVTPMSLEEASFQKIVALPKAWGEAVESTDQTTQRFLMQTSLATEKYQNVLRLAAKNAGISFDEIVQMARDVANEGDALANRKKSVTAAREGVRDLRRQALAATRADNPLAGAMADFESGGRYEFAPDRRYEMYNAQMATVTTQNAQALKEAAQAEQQRVGALKAAMPVLNAYTAGTAVYEVVLERMNKKFEAWNSTQIRGLLAASKEFEKWGGAARKAADRVRARIKELQAHPLIVDPGAIARLQLQEKGLRDQSHAFFAGGAKLRKQANQDVQKDTTKSDEGDALEQEAARKRLSFEADFQNRQAGYLEVALRNIEVNEALNERQKAVDQARLTWVHNKDLELRGNKDFAAPFVDKKTGTTNVKGLGDAARAEAERQAGLVDFSAGFETDDIKAYNASMLEAAKAKATFNDLTGLAALKFEQEKGALSTLTAEQKAQMIVNAAAVAGIQKYASEMESLFSQRFSLAEENLTRQIALTRGLSAVEQQELKWKFADAELRERLAGMSEEERKAYDEQRTKILAARDAVRSLLAVQQRLAAGDWYKNIRRAFRELADTNEIRRAGAELREQLEEQGFDEVTIKIMVDTNDMLLRLQRSQEHVRDYVQGVSEVFGHAWDEAYEKGPGHFISATLDGFANMIQGVARQLITAQLTKLFVKAFPSLAGEYDQAQTKAEGMNAATLQTAGVSHIAALAVEELTQKIKEYSEAAGNVPSIAGALHSGSSGGLFGGLLNLATGFFGGGGKKGSAAPTTATGPISSGLASGGRGLFRDFAATNALHSNLSQSVLARRDAEMFNAISSNTSSIGRQIVPVGGGDTNLNIGNLNLPKVREGRDFMPELHKAVGPRLSRRSQQNAAWDGVSAGKRQR